MKIKKGFTLVEMLIVIVIIGILAAALIPRLMSVQARARDTKRKTDLYTLYEGIKIYYNDNGVYPQPTCLAWTNAYDTNRYVFSWMGTPIWISGMVEIMTSMPHDPLNTYNVNNGPGGLTYAGPFYNGNFVYSYGNVFRKNTGVWGRDYFDLRAQLENHSDPIRNEVMSYTYNRDNQPLRPGNSAYMFAITPSSASGP